MNTKLTKIPPFKVNKDKPFEGDALNRKEICETWTRFIENSSTPFVLAVDAEWGNGKTVFLQMWRAHLKNQGFTTVFFDAWSYDFHSEALPALIGEIQRETDTKSESDRFKKFKEKGKKVVKFLPSAVAKSVIRTIVVKTVGEKAGETLIDDMQKHDKIQDYIDYREAVDEFKKQLGKLAEEQEKPLVIFIDELDRCRPTFALEVLEKVKHIFDVEGIFFVVGLSKSAIIKTVRSEYGEINGDVYLQKFFDATIRLPNEGKTVETFLRKAGITEQEISFFNDFLNTLLCVFSILDVSLRAKEQIISLLKLIFTGVSTDNRLVLCLYLFFATLRVKDPELFRKAANSLNAGTDIIQSFPLDEFQSLFKDHRAAQSIKGENADFLMLFIIESVLVIYEILNKQYSPKPEPEGRVGKQDLVRMEIQKCLYNWSPGVEDYGIFFKKLINRIDLVEIPSIEGSKDE